MTIDKINELKKEKNAVILAHYYTNSDVQMAADFVGDSYYLSKAAKETDADIIVFCGVRFMGESALLLNPTKKVLMPDLESDCAMAHMISEEKIKKMREKYSDLAVCCYINSNVKAKMLSDVCVTSSNAVKIVRNIPNKNIYFIPDSNLGRYVKEQVKEKNVILNDGYCPIHTAIKKEDVKKAKEKYKNAKFLVHPECMKEVLDEADFIGSTKEIIDFAKTDSSKEYIIGTEDGVIFELQRQNPNKKFYTVNENQVCKDMRLNSLEKIYDVLKNEKNEITLDVDTIKKALKPLEKMLEIAK